MLNVNYSNSPIRLIATYFAWFIIGFVILLAIPLLMGASMIQKESLWHNITRDIGIGFVVAAIVAASFELYARSRFEIETMKSVLDAAIGEIIPIEVWTAVKGQIIERNMIRKEVSIHLKLHPITEFPNTAILWMQFEYDLHGLRSAPRTNILMHYMEDHITYNGFPRFEYIQVGETVYLDLEKSINRLDGSTNRAKIMDGKFTADVRLEEGKSVHVVTQREEVTYVPGTYNLVMGELVEGIKLYLTELPNDLVATANVRPHTEHPVSFEVNKVLEFPAGILLPGQCIEFRFKRKDP